MIVKTQLDKEVYSGINNDNNIDEPDDKVKYNMLDYTHFREALFVMAYYRNFINYKPPNDPKTQAGRLVADTDRVDNEKDESFLAATIEIADASLFQKFLNNLKLNDNFSRTLKRVVEIQESKKAKKASYFEGKVSLCLYKKKMPRCFRISHQRLIRLSPIIKIRLGKS